MTHKEVIEILQTAISDAEFKKSHFEIPHWGCLRDENRAKMVTYLRNVIEANKIAIEALERLESLRNSLYGLIDGGDTND